MAQVRLSPLAIAVLALLREEPMHPYRMQGLIRHRAMEQVVNVRNRSALYQVIQRLERDGLVRVRHTERPAGHPERTLYELTDDGQDELDAWLREGVAVPAREFPVFPAAVSFLHLLTPGQARRHLEARLAAVVERLDAVGTMTATSKRERVARVHLLEHEYVHALLVAERDWVNGVLADLRSGRLTWRRR